MKHVAPMLGTALSLVMLACGGSSPEGAEPAAVAEDLRESAPLTVRDEPVVDEGAAPKVSFVAARDCEGIAGTWRGQVYSEVHGGYYEFTAQIAQPDLERPELTGSMVARSWQGPAEDVAPPETCDTGFHWTVLEDAAGSLREDGSLSFDATTWRVGEHFCGDRVTNYSLDQLEELRPLGDGVHTTTLSGIVKDPVIWTDGLPIELTRIACE
jgi:hypothetical protein